MANPAINPAQPYYPPLDPSIPAPTQTHLKNLYTAVNQHNQAIIQVQSNLTAATLASTTAATTATASNSTAVTSFNSTTGAISYFPQMGVVNNQAGVTAYTTQSSDCGAVVVLNDSSAIAITLNFNVSVPYYTTISNQGAGIATITPSQGLINGVASLTLTTQTFVTVYFDGTNWWADASGAGGSVYSLGGTLTTANITLGSGAGSGATVAVTGLDGTHTITLTTGSSPAALSTLFTVTFTTSRGHDPSTILMPGSFAAYSSLAQIPVPTNSTATGYTVETGNALSASFVYIFFVSCP